MKQTAQTRLFVTLSELMMANKNQRCILKTIVLLKQCNRKQTKKKRYLGKQNDVVHFFESGKITV